MWNSSVITAVIIKLFTVGTASDGNDTAKKGKSGNCRQSGNNVIHCNVTVVYATVLR